MFFDIIGWVGSGLVVLAYLLLSAKKISAGLMYQLLNLLGALFIAIGLFPKNAWFSFTLQVVWGIIAIGAIIKISSSKTKKKRH